jgi:hypothetical protein
MKLRPLILVVVLVSAFWFFTSHYSPLVDGHSLGHFSLFNGKSANPSLHLSEADADTSYDAQLRRRRAEQHRCLQACAAFGRQHYVHDSGL